MHGTAGVDFERIIKTYTQFGECRGNEVYAHTKAISFDHYGGEPGSVLTVYDTTSWNNFFESTFIYGSTQSITLDGMTVRGYTLYGITVNSQEGLVTIRNADVRIGVGQFGLEGTHGISYQGGVGLDWRLVVEDSYVMAPISVGIPAAHSAGAPVNLAAIAPYCHRTMILRNVVLENPPGQVVPVLVRLDAGGYVPAIGASVYVYDHQGIPGDDFQLLYDAQHPDAILIAESELGGGPNVYAGLEVGQTNAEAKAEYGRCVGDELVPDGAVLEPAGYVGAYKISLSDYEADIASDFGDVRTFGGRTRDRTSVTCLARTGGMDLIVVSLSWLVGGSAAVLSDSEGNTWTPLTQRTVSLYGYNQLYYCVNPITSHDHRIRAVHPNGGYGYPAMGVVAAKGAHASPFLVENGAGLASTTSIQPGSITPAHDGCLIVTGVISRIGGSTTVDSGFTARTIEFGDFSVRGGIAWKVQETAAAVNPTWTRVETASEMAASIAAFRPA